MFLFQRSASDRAANRWRRGVARTVAVGLSLTGTAVLSGLAAAPAAQAVAGVTQRIIAQSPNLRSPYGMEFSPDGRLWVLEQGRGTVRIVKNDVLLATPALTLAVEVGGSRGLMSLVFDPAFSTNRFLYLQYSTSRTVAGVKTVFNRVSRFTSTGDLVDPASERMVWEGLPLDDKTMHYGGGMWFGPDGKLYLSLGDRLLGPNAQNMNTQWGKILRLNPDGTIPTDNPFFTTTTGNNRAIYALGLRNPWQSQVRRSTGAAYVSDVGSATWEEVDQAARGANYGWPGFEGPSNGAPGITDPLFWYNHTTGTPTGCAVVGADFYEPTTALWPAAFQGTLIVADLCQGWLKSVDVDHGNVLRDIADGFEQPVDVKVGSAGQIYVLTKQLNGVLGGALFRLDFNPNAPLSITQQPVSQTGALGGTVTFSSAATGGVGPVTYQWQRGGVDVAGATNPTLTLSNLAAADSGATFQVRVSDGVTTLTSAVATLMVTTNQAPVPTILTPTAGQTYRAGAVLSWSGTATDAEDGTVPPARMTWSVDFHHNTHVHDFILPTTGAATGSATIPVDNETDTNVWYRVHLVVTDSQGAQTEVTRDVFPKIVTVTLNSTPTTMRLTLDAQPVTTPLTFQTVQGIRRRLAPVTPQTHAGSSFVFSGWADGAAATRMVAPLMNKTFTANFTAAAPPIVDLVVGDSAVPTAGETTVRSHLADLGFTVRVIDDSQSAAVNLAGVSLVMVTGTVSDAQVNGAFKPTTVPVLIWKPSLYDSLGMVAAAAGSAGRLNGVSTVDVAGPHPAVGDLTGSNVTLVTAPSSIAFGTPGAAADVLATTGPASSPVLFAYQQGDLLVDGGVAAGCRVGFPAWDSALVRYTAPAWQLFGSTVRFATDGCAA